MALIKYKDNNDQWQTLGLNVAVDATPTSASPHAVSSGGVYTALGSKQPQHTATTGTLSVAGWSNNTQTISVTGVTASNTVIVAPAPASTTDWTDGGIYASAQGAGTLTFTCDTVPTNAITVNVLIMDQG